MKTRQKGIFTVKQATAQAFKTMPQIFDGISLVTMARALMGRPGCFDGTILRRLRELRDEKPAEFNYKVIDTDLSKYKKITA